MQLVVRQLTKTVPNWKYYPRLGILNPQWGEIYPIGYLEHVSQVKLSPRTNPQSPFLLNIPDRGLQITNWGCYVKLGI